VRNCTLLDAETLVFTQFLPMTATNPCKLLHFCALFELLFCLDERKKRWYLRVFQKIEDRDVNETL
jgi:hypothetical protein